MEIALTARVFSGPRRRGWKGDFSPSVPAGIHFLKKMNRAQNLAVLRPTHYMIRGKMMSTFGNQAGALASLV